MSCLAIFHIVSGLSAFLLGSIMHFAYKWSGYNSIISLVAPVNESIWEHQKLLFYPVLLFSFIELFIYGQQYPNFLQVKILSIMIGIAVIIMSFYTYSGILGHNVLIFDIGTFVLGVLASYISSYYFLQTDSFTSQTSRFVLLTCLILLLFGFIVFTDTPPHIALFNDPVTNTYGRKQSK